MESNVRPPESGVRSSDVIAPGIVPPPGAVKVNSGSEQTSHPNADKENALQKINREHIKIT